MNHLKTSLEMWCDDKKKSCKSYVTLMWTLFQIQHYRDTLKVSQFHKDFLQRYLQFFQKKNGKLLDTSGRIVFVHFLEELKTPKNDISKLTDLYDVPIFYLPEILNFFNSAGSVSQSYFVLRLGLAKQDLWSLGVES